MKREHKAKACMGMAESFSTHLVKDGPKKRWWSLAWRTDAMQASAFWYFELPEQGIAAALRIGASVAVIEGLVQSIREELTACQPKQKRERRADSPPKKSRKAKEARR